jgi:hypothetical protein
MGAAVLPLAAAEDQGTDCGLGIHLYNPAGEEGHLHLGGIDPTTIALAADPLFK